jgi:sporozoite microneme protein 2
MGNPSGDPILQIDPGFRAPVIALEYSPPEEQVLLSRDKSMWVPTNGYYYPEQSCSRTQTSVKIVGMADYQRALGADASIAQGEFF